ncbi:MAG: hypothetical protein ACOY46_09120 [Bacillota bacterium]
MEKKDIFQIIKGSGEPPVCASPEEVQITTVGIPFSIDIVTSDPGGIITGIEFEDIPQWAKLESITELPSPDAVARISGTPGAEDKGLHVMTVIATNNVGEKAGSLLKIKVDECFTED